MRALITGTSRGLGLEFCRQMLARGDRVFATCRRPEVASHLNELKEKFPALLTITAMDSADVASIESSYQAITRETDALDLLVNNAGINLSDERLGKMQIASMLEVFTTNAAGPMLIAQRFLNLLAMGDHPRIVNITSGLGSLTNTSRGGDYSYCASKAALNMYTRVMSFDVREMGITAIVMDPGWVKTDMGGPNAWITPEESIGGMLKVIDSLTMEDTGHYRLYDGSEIPW
jgi:NAD(P)-dependent dehydrogenase (short-subunit alcohol dehydrogenase family)